jgi:phage/plasmid-associated DNA primase
MSLSYIHYFIIVKLSIFEMILNCDNNCNEEHTNTKITEPHTFNVNHWAPYVHPDDLHKLQTFVNAIGNDRYGKLIVLYGRGCNGKSTFVNELSKYVDVKRAPACSIIKKSCGEEKEQSSCVDCCIGDCVVVQEVEKDDKINEEFIKQYLTGERTEYRKLYKDIDITHFENCNMMFVTNTLENVQHMLDDPTMSKFVDVIRFTHTFSDTNEYNIDYWKPHIHAEDFDELQQFTYNVINKIKHPRIMVFFGTGSNGKSTFIDHLSKHTNVTHVRFPTKYSSELEAAAYTKNLVVIHHCLEGDCISVCFSILKSFHAGEQIVCRNLYENPKMLSMDGNMIIVLNSQKALDIMLTDRSIVERVKVVRFTTTF